MNPDIPVLIVGGGPTGLATSIMLSRLGIGSLLVERHADTAIHPKAVGISTRTMELFRQWGIESRVRAAAIDVEFASSVRTVLSGPEHVRGSLGYPDVELAHTLSPTAPAACAQDMLEPILLSHARNYDGAELCFDTELVSIEQDESGVEATLVDRATNRGRLVRARYVVAADGASSPLRRKLGIEMTGNGAIGDHLSILFNAELIDAARAPLCALYVINNEIASGIMCPTSREGRWIFATPWKSGAPLPDPSGLVGLVRIAAGVPDLDVDLIDASIVSLGAQVANQFRKGRVFLAGDSAHRMTPSGGMGMNTAIHAAHNLAWKLAAVLNGWAAPSLLDTYETERRPVGERNVARSIGKLPELTGIAADMGAVYSSPAVLATDTATTGDASATEQGWVKPGLPARVGQRVPHLWIERDGVRVSTLDLAERGMVLLASADGASWCEPAAAAARTLGIPLETCVVQARAAFTSADHLWHSYFGLDSRSAVLLRPDGHIAWYGPATSAEPTMEVSRALAAVLGLGAKGTATSAPVQTQARKRKSRASQPMSATTGEWRRSRRTSTQT